MKIIIDGKTYSTEDAIKAGSKNMSFYEDNYVVAAVVQDLYLMPTGDFFLWGYGIAETGYGCCLDDCCGIFPLTKEKAGEWLANP